MKRRCGPISVTGKCHGINELRHRKRPEMSSARTRAWTRKPAARWAFIEAATCVIKSKTCPANLRRLYDRLTHGGRTHKSQAKVAVARELCELVYVIWKKGEPYRETTSPARSRRTKR